ncbi:MAG: DMT family transporter [Oscillospiraceae bacterium]|nr:DMT family transporter [Oscillospiraceae bacterium]
MALFSILIWGSTFAATRMLLNAGMRPDEIMIIRFVIAYILLWVIHPRFMRPVSFKREFLYFLAGACGVTLYFLAENEALSFTTVSNTSLLVTAAPLFTGIFAAILWRQKLSAAFFAGFIVAMTGVVLILFQGGIPKVYPKGDILALGGAVCWAVYTLTVKKTDGKNVNVLAATRRIFFYGNLLFIPMVFLLKTEFHLEILKDTRHLAQILFLSVIASALCYVTWNKAAYILGAVKANVYIYLVPVTALLTARLFFDEALTATGWIGAVLVLTGLVVSNLRKSS